MANGFDSAGAGFSRGFLGSRQLKIEREDKAARRRAAEADSLRESISTARTQSLEGFKQAIELASKASEAGADDEQIAAIRQIASSSLASFAQTAQSLRQQAAQSGATEDVIAALPDGLAFVRQHLPLFDATVQAGRLRTPAAQGASEADKTMGEVEALAGRLGKSVDQVAQAMGILPKDERAVSVGQRNIKGIGEAEVLRDADSGLFFIQDEKGVPTFIASTDMTTPPERVEQGGPGAFDPRTQAQQGEAVTKFLDAAIGGVGAIEQGTELLKIAQQSPESLGAPGAIARVGNEFIRTAVGLGNMLGIDVGAERDIDAFSYEGFTGNLREVAIENQAFRAGVYGVAFAAAVADQGLRPTDKDIQAFIDQIAGSTADPQAFSRTITQFVERIDRKLRAVARINRIPKENQDAAFAEFDRALAGFRSQAGGSDGAGDLLSQAEEALNAGDIEKAEELMRQLEQNRGN